MDRYKNYHWITPDVAVGDWLTPNSLFSLIVDLNFPDNQAKENDIYVLGNIIHVGLIDDINAEIQPLVTRVMSLIKETPHKKILFRCRMGVSRSVTFACFYLADTLQISAIQALEMIKEKRRVADPNPGFLLTLKTDFL